MTNTEQRENSPIKRYSSDFYESYKNISGSAAEIVASIIMELVRPASVIDFGCGTGIWLSAFSKLGVGSVMGVDGDYVDRNRLLIPSGDFLAANLELPVRLDRTFDLAMSVEVAEHLSEGSAMQFVHTLCSAAPVVMFGAAIPFQGGEHHVNEQWQSYWAELFAQNGYRAVDCIRKRVWNNPCVAYYYAQNTLVYLDARRIDEYPLLKEELRNTDLRMLSAVHPAKWEEANGPKGIPLGRLVRLLPSTLVRTIGAKAVSLLPEALRQSVKKLRRSGGGEMQS